MKLYHHKRMRHGVRGMILIKHLGEYLQFVDVLSPLMDMVCTTFTTVIEQKYEIDAKETEINALKCSTSNLELHLEKTTKDQIWLRARLGDASKKMESWNELAKEQKQWITQLHDEKAALEDKNNKLRQEKAALEDKNDKLLKEEAAFKDKIDKLQQENTALEKANAALQQNMTTLKAVYEIKCTDCTGGDAFTKYPALTGGIKGAFSIGPLCSILIC